MTKVVYLFFLLFCLLCTGEVVAQSDSVRFFIRVDSAQSGIRAGQDVALRYICNVQYDSMLSPRFDASVELVKEAVAHRAGKALINGELADIHEVGFEYIIRFQTVGKYDLPLSSVMVNGQRYQTPPVSVQVHPALTDIGGVECSISVYPERPHQGERFIVTLTCNRQPDRKRPTVTLDGEAMESAGHRYSGSNRIEEFQFMYGVDFANSGSRVVSVKDLSFGGIPYTMPDVEIEVAGSTKHRTESGGPDSVWSWLVFVGIYLLLTHLTLWLRFRKESGEGLAAFVLVHHRLSLTTEWAYTHYGFPLVILMLPFVFVSVSLYAYITGDGEMLLPLFWFGLLPLALAFVSYCRQRSKLNFEPVATTLLKEQIQQAIIEVAAQNNWTIDYLGDDCIAAHTNRSYPSLSWGEQVFVVFDKGQVWVNSVNDLNKKSVMCSFGYTKKNIRLLKEAIEGKRM